MSGRSTRNGSGEKESRLTRSIVIKLPENLDPLYCLPPGVATRVGTPYAQSLTAIVLRHPREFNDVSKESSNYVTLLFSRH